MKVVGRQRLAVALILTAMLFALCFSAEAQQPKRIPRIGYVTSNSSAAISTRTEAFRQGLRKLGYVEGKNIVIEWRSAEGKLDRLPVLAGELVRLNSDVIVSAGGNATAKRYKGSDPYNPNCRDQCRGSRGQRLRRQLSAARHEYYGAYGN